MLAEIKSWITGKVLFSCEVDTSDENLGIKLCLEAGVKAGANLAFANLDGARLDGARLDGANLYGARLDGASLDGASLVRANLDGARLYGARLYGANLDGATRLPEGCTFAEFLAEIVPHLLTAGGKTIDQIRESGCWECHEWANCPMHAALSIDGESDAPVLLRPWVRQFVQLFDAGLIPAPWGETKETVAP